MSSPKLYVIASPIGHKQDITLRALSILSLVNIFFVEDSRETKKLFALHQISLEGKRFYSYATHNLLAATKKAIEILQSGESICLLSDRGTPGLSDPGQLLVHEAHKNAISVIPIPGPPSINDHSFPYV